MQASEVCHTVKVKPWSKDQGDFVEINAEDFDPDIHEHLGAARATAAPDEGAPAHKPARRKGKR